MNFIANGYRSVLDFLDRHPVGLTASSGVMFGVTALSTFDLLLKFFQVAIGCGTAMLIFTNLYRKWYGSKKLKKPVINLLLIDDNENDQQLFSRAFTLAGCEVTTASNMKEAEDVLRNLKRKVDIVLLDAIIPGEDTTHMFRRINTLRPLTPCAVFSGISDPKMQEQINAISPGTPFFLKNHDSERFAATVIETLKLGAPH